MQILISDNGEVTITDTSAISLAEALNPSLESELGTMSRDYILQEVRQHFPLAKWAGIEPQTYLSTGVCEYLLSWEPDGTIQVSTAFGDQETALTIDELVNYIRLSEVSPAKMLNQLDQIALLVDQENAMDLDELYDELRDILGQQDLRQDHR